MTTLSGEFRVELAPHDALVACVDAIDGFGWEVEAVEPRRVVAAPDGVDGTEFEIALTGSGDATAVRITGSAPGTDAERLGEHLNQAQSAIERGGVADPYLEPKMREHLQRVTASDRSWARLLRVLSLALVIASVIVIAEAAVTLLWQEPLSYVYARGQQGELDDRLRKVESRYRRAEQRRGARPAPEAPPTLRELATRFAGSARPGDPLGRIRAAAIDLDAVIVEGTDAESLRKGPAHYENTPLPGQGGTVGIAGHRTTYSAPFRDLDDLGRGDEVVVRMPYGALTYRVEGTAIVSPQDVWVLRRVRQDRLTMTACHPLFSDAERIAVFARLVGQRRLPTRGRGT